MQCVIYLIIIIIELSFLQCGLGTKKLDVMIPFDGRQQFAVKKSYWLVAVSMLTCPVLLI